MRIRKLFAILRWFALVWACACGADDDWSTYTSPTNTGPMAGTVEVTPPIPPTAGSVMPDVTTTPPIVTPTGGTGATNGAADAGVADANVVLVEPDAGSGDGGGWPNNNPTDGAVDAGVEDANIEPADPDAAADSGGGDSGEPNDDESPCAGGQFWPASDDIDARASIGDHGNVFFVGPPTLKITGLETVMTVPERPSSNGTLYIWPGLQPVRGGENYNPIGLGVLQPVLTWGTSAGDFLPRFPTGWYMAPQYVNPWTSIPEYYYTHGSGYIYVDPGDVLDTSILLDGTVWSQYVFDRQTGEEIRYDIDMAGQAQSWALFEIERPGSSQNKPSHDIVFTSTVLTFANPSPEACEPTERGPEDYFAPPQSSPDGTTCCISKIILRAPGVPATEPNTP